MNSEWKPAKICPSTTHNTNVVAKADDDIEQQPPPSSSRKLSTTINIHPKPMSSRPGYQRIPSTKYVLLSSLRKVYESLTFGDVLNLRDKEFDDTLGQFMGENTNLALVCALLLTTFIPLYYQEPNRLNIPEDGLTLDLSLGFWQHAILHIDKVFIHDFFDITYFGSMSSMLVGTITSVLLILMGNEAGNQRRASILFQQLGIIKRFPYFCMNTGCYMWGASIVVHCVLVPRTMAGLILKVVLFLLIVYSFVILAIPTTVRALYSAFKEVDEHPPVTYTVEEIKEKVDDYFGYMKASNDLSYDFDDCKKSMHLLTEEHGFEIPLAESTEIDFTRIFYQRLAQEKDMPYQELMNILLLRK